MRGLLLITATLSETSSESFEHYAVYGGPRVAEAILCSFDGDLLDGDLFDGDLIPTQLRRSRAAAISVSITSSGLSGLMGSATAETVFVSGFQFTGP